MDAPATIAGQPDEAVGLERRDDRWRVAVRGPRGDAAIDARIVIAADGGDLVRLGRGSEPDWSPDGEQIVAVRGFDPNTGQLDSPTATCNAVDISTPGAM